MDIVVIPFLQVLTTVIHLYTWALILSIIINWLILFNVINTHNHFVSIVTNFLYRITEPALAQIRRFLPNLGGIDLSPLIFILGLYFIEGLLAQIARKILSF